MSEPISIAAMMRDLGRASSAWIVAGLRQAAAAALAYAGSGAKTATSSAQKIEQKGRIAAIGAALARRFFFRSAHSRTWAEAQTPPNSAKAAVEEIARTCQDEVARPIAAKAATISQAEREAPPLRHAAARAASSPRIGAKAKRKKSLGVARIIARSGRASLTWLSQ